MAKPGTVALCMCVLALAGAITFELRAGPKSRPPVPDAVPLAVPRTAAEPNISVADDKNWLETTLARPLFSSARRPPSIAQADKPVATRAELPRLAGIMIDGPRRSVIFTPTGDKKPIVVAEGGSLDGFRVDRIEPGTVIVSGPGVHETLRTSFDLNAPVPTRQPVSPVPPPNQVVFNGPPGLDRMPPLAPAGTGPVTSPIRGLPSIGNMVGIPGLAAPPR